MAELDLYTYTDYRKLLSDFYYSQKKKKASYSYKAFAERAGLNSPNYLKLVMDGRRNLSHKNIKKFARGLGLLKYDSDFFESLVYYNQAQDNEAKETYLGKLKSLKRLPQALDLNDDQKEVVTKWYYFAIREMALLSGFKRDAHWIAERLGKKITTYQAEEALEVLEKLGLLARENGSMRQNQRNITVDFDSAKKPHAINEFHRSMGTHALEALRSDNYQEREFNALTVAVSKENLKTVKEKIREFRRELNAFLGTEKNPEEVYQLNVQFFPLTRTKKDD